MYRAEGLLPSLGGLIRVLYNETQSSLTWLVSLGALPTIHYCPRLPFVCLTGASNAQCKHWLLSVEVRLVLPCGTHNFAPPHLSTRTRVASRTFYAHGQVLLGAAARLRRARTLSLVRLGPTAKHALSDASLRLFRLSSRASLI